MKKRYINQLLTGLLFLSISGFIQPTIAEEAETVILSHKQRHKVRTSPTATQNSIETLSNPQLDFLEIQSENLSVQAIPAPEPPQTEVLNQLQQYSNEGQSKRQRQNQVTSVSQLSDVQPTDWAFQALQSLVERYGCIVGYPDGTFKGNRALTRYEFAAGVNACLERITELIDTATSDLVTREDLAILQRLQEEFAAELAALRGRVTTLEARTAELEANQFSTTTKLRGNAIFAIADVFGEDDSNQTVLQQRVNLNFISSFTGKDALVISLFEGNAPVARVGGEELFGGGTFDLPGVNFTTAVGGRQFSGVVSTAEGTLSSQFSANTGGDFLPVIIAYAFPVTPRLQALVTTQFAPFQAYAPTLNPYLDDLDSGRGAISVFGEYNPIYALSGGGAGVIFNYLASERLRFTAGYLADGLNASKAGEGRGLFNGGHGILGQVTWYMSDSFSIAGIYTNTYSQPGRFGFNYNALGVTGTAVANTLAGQDILGSGLLPSSSSAPVSTDGYGLNFFLGNQSQVYPQWLV
jgi:BMFP domain-containing protein YqiC